MRDDILKEIIILCLCLEHQAARIYREFAGRTDDPKLKSFWQKMAREELEHASYWTQLFALSRKGMIPQIFDRPFQVKEELQVARKKVQNLLDRSRSSPSITNAFLLAYRMEFCLLHPAIETLFQLVETITGEHMAADQYERHLNSFFVALAEYGAETPELELLAETIQVLWKENRSLIIQIHTDSLSGLLNRRGLHNAMIPLSHLAERNRYNVGIIMLDLDNFKKINDTFGHDVGDKIIAEIGRIIKSSIRRSDLAARYGGEEFLIYMSDVRSDSLEKIAESIRMRIESEIPRMVTPLMGRPVTASMGLAQDRFAGDPEKLLDELIKRADQALYIAKESGKNKTVMCPTVN